MTRRLLAIAVALGWLVRAFVPEPAVAQLDPTIRDRIVPAAVEVALIADVTDNDQVEHDYLPIGSGTIVSPDGLVLTNWHVVDRAANQDQIDQFEAKQQAAGHTLTIDLDPDRVVLLTTNGVAAPTPTYLATVAAHDADLDLAVLQISGDDRGRPLAAARAVPFVPLGNSDALRLGDPLHVFSYPSIGGDILTYAPGVVSGFEHAEGLAGVAWITTNATMAGGSSGGTAVNAAGELVGVPTQGTALDCRPGDTNQDGTIDAKDVGCIPTGGSIGVVRPINLAKPLLAHAGFVGQSATSTVPPSPTMATIPPAFPPTKVVGTAPTPEPVATSTDRGAQLLATAMVEASMVATARDELASYCADGPIYAPGTRVVVTARWPRYIDYELYQVLVASPRTSQSHGALQSLGALKDGTLLVITGPYVEGGTCDWWPVRVVDPHGASTLSVGQTGYVLEQYLRPAG